MKNMRVSTLSIIVALLLLGMVSPRANAGEMAAWNPMRIFQSGGTPPVSSAVTAPVPETQEAEDKNSKAKKSSADEDLTPLPPNVGAIIQTEKGNIALELYPEQAPQTVRNFVSLVNDKFYNVTGMKFHRVVPGFVIQTGDPTGTGMGGSKKRIPLEAKNKLSHNAKGVVAMARGGDPNSATSQFYITLAPQKSLDGKYAIFGRVLSGLDVLEKIKENDKVYGVEIIDATTIVPDKKDDKKGFTGSLKSMLTGKS